MSSAVAQTKGPFQILREYSAFLIIGSVAALVWANTDLASYLAFINTAWGHPSVLGIPIGHHGFNLHFAVNDIFMVFFFGIATKEVMEAFLPGGPLSSIRKASLPVISTLGGVVGPAGWFAIACVLLAPHLMRGWAVPTATDIAYSWLFAGLIFGYKHPATKFLLALAVLDDLIGMVIIAVFYSSTIEVQWLLLVVAAIVICAVFRWVVKVDSYWPYLLIGLPLAWFGLLFTGVHAALALVPIVPFLPHEKRDMGMFEEEDTMENDEPPAEDGHEHEHHPTDALNRFEHEFKPFVDIGLLTFGLCNAGVPFGAIGLETWITVTAIFFGKTIGIYLFTVIGRAFKLSLPAGMTMREAFVMGNVAAIGFTVALFVTDVAFRDTGGGGHATEDSHAVAEPGGGMMLAFASSAADDHAGHDHAAGEHATGSSEAPVDASEIPPPPPGAKFDDLTKDQQQVVEDKVKMGALLSFFAGLTSMILAKMLGVRKINTDQDLKQRIRELGAVT